MTETTQDTSNLVDESLRRRYEADWTAGSAGTLARLPAGPGIIPGVLYLCLASGWKYT